MTDINQVKVIVTGRVQGVFYRDHTRQAAIETGVTGYVKNLADGSVEAVFQGEAEKVDQMIAWCRKGSPSSKVTNVKVIPDLGLPDFPSFTITY
jgi:acylphosphatase